VDFSGPVSPGSFTASDVLVEGLVGGTKTVSNTTSSQFVLEVLPPSNAQAALWPSVSLGAAADQAGNPSQV
jgi:hypothetical protein